MIEHTLPAAAPEMALERYLRRAWPLLPGRILRELSKKRDVRINGVRSDGRAVVRGGDRLAIYADARWFEPEPEVLWTDERLVAAVKPQGLPVDVDRDGIGADTLLARLRRRWPEIQLCHRLDAQTGGIVLAAAGPDVLAQALEAFRAHSVRKEYLALALGRFDRPEGTLRAWLVKDARRAEVRIVHREQPGSRPVETRYRVLGEAAPGLWRVALEPVTGRTHQLRAHLADFGHPLLGDDHYGDRAANRRHPGMPLCLWHQRLTVPGDSPLVDYRGRTFEAPAPDWLQKSPPAKDAPGGQEEST